MSKERCAKRIQEALNCSGMKQTDLSRITGIPKSAISQYISGAFEPKQDRIELMAHAFGVSEAWLMGFDVPNPKTDLSDEAKMIGAAYDKAAPKDKQMVKYILSDYMDDASDLPPLQIAASNGAKLELSGDLLDVDLSGEDSKIP